MMNLIKDGNQNFKKKYPDRLSGYNLIGNFTFLFIKFFKCNIYDLL